MRVFCSFKTGRAGVDPPAFSFDFWAGWPARALQARLALSARYKRKEAPASSGARGGVPLIGTLVEEAEVHNCDASYLAQRRFYGPLTCSHSCRLL